MPNNKMVKGSDPLSDTSSLKEILFIFLVQQEGKGSFGFMRKCRFPIPIEKTSLKKTLFLFAHSLEWQQAIFPSYTFFSLFIKLQQRWQRKFLEPGINVDFLFHPLQSST